jgi:hypothetical protein
MNLLKASRGHRGLVVYLILVGTEAQLCLLDGTLVDLDIKCFYVNERRSHIGFGQGCRKRNL